MIPAFGTGLAVSAAASGTTPPKASYACLKGGTLSTVSNSKARCSSGYKAVDWDKAGPQGVTGPPLVAESAYDPS